MAESSLHSNVLAPLLNRIASAAMESTDSPRAHSESLHIAEAYQVDPCRNLFIQDLEGAPAVGIDIASQDGNWGTCNVGNICARCTAGDVGLILTPGEAPTRVVGRSPDSELAKVPIESCVSCFKDSFGNHYSEEPNSKLWWTRDNEQHGGVVFKTYKKVGKTFEFEADRDQQGIEIAGKHKGPKGSTISISTLARCANPGRHAN
ncbi:hypothetical protein [Rhodococcus erythropolis]|uniref:hypothetical protein n=1 Tax=Rhodococcus erythropolis TaxID=1833 RepID=UPI00366C6F62